MSAMFVYENGRGVIRETYHGDGGNLRPISGVSGQERVIRVHTGSAVGMLNSTSSNAIHTRASTLTIVPSVWPRFHLV